MERLVGFANIGFHEENVSGDQEEAGRLTDQIKVIKTNPDIIYGLLEDPAAHRTVPGKLQPQLWQVMGEPSAEQLS